MSTLALGTDTTGMIGQVRLLIQDVSSAGYALTSAQITSILNDRYLWYKDTQQDRSKCITPTAFVAEKFAGVGVGLQPGKNLTVSGTYKKIIAIIKATPVSVATCITSSNTTLTSGSSFSNVRVGSEIVGTDITTGTTVVSVDMTSQITMSAIATGSHTLLTMKFYAPDASVGTPVERVEMNEFYDAYANGINAYALEREPGNSGKWTVHYSPATGETTPTPCVAVVVPEVTALSASGDTPELTDHESYMICRMAAVDACRLIGREADMSAIAQSLPQEMKDALGVSSFMRQPRTRPSEESF